MEPLPFDPDEILPAREVFRRLSAQRRAARHARVLAPTLYVVATEPTLEFMVRIPGLPAARERLLQLQDNCCYLCGAEFTIADPPTVDHVMPKARGGRTRNNILLACFPCNNGKADRAPTDEEIDYLAYINGQALSAAPKPAAEPGSGQARKQVTFLAAMEEARAVRLAQ